MFQNKSLMDYFVPALYYTLFVGAIVHLITLAIGLWLAVKFRQITMLPPDMNPLEANLTSRHQKTMSMATTATYLSENEKRLSTPYEDRRRSMPYDDVDRPPAVPFHATRSPRNSFGSADYPPRQYQITPGNSPHGSPRASPRPSPRNSAYGADFKRMSAPPGSSHSSHAPSPPPRSPWRHSHSPFSEASTSDIADFRPPYGRAPVQAPSSPTKSFGAPPSPGGYGRAPPSPQGPSPQSRPGTAHSARQQPPPMNQNPANASQPRPAKFTEAWYATESLFNRTHERNRAMNAAGNKPGKGQAYAAVNRRDDSDSDSDYENDGKAAGGGYRYRNLMSPDADEFDDGDLGSSPKKPHPNPLRSNPSLPSIAGFGNDAGTNSRPKSMPGPATQQQKQEEGGRRPHTPFLRKTSALSEIDLNDRRVSGGNAPNPSTTTPKGGDISDEKPYGALKPSASKRYTWAPTNTTPRNRDSSIQPESDFYSKPYGELKSATPPLIVGSDRQVSSGNDYGKYLGGAPDGPVAKAKRNFSFGKRNVSGKVAEEGRAIGWAR